VGLGSGLSAAGQVMPESPLLFSSVVADGASLLLCCQEVEESKSPLRASADHTARATDRKPTHRFPENHAFCVRLAHTEIHCAGDGSRLPAFAEDMFRGDDAGFHCLGRTRKLLSTSIPPTCGTQNRRNKARMCVKSKDRYKRSLSVAECLTKRRSHDSSYRPEGGGRPLNF
jgi:hypothetical protein